jgi:signal transduction histidine kinase/ligand-binding sensor domain-containing protein
VPVLRAPLAALVLLCALAPWARALDPGRAFSQYRHDVWQVEQGLPQNAVQAIVQSRDGYLWLGTQEGLARFDGVRFSILDTKNTPGLRHNSIQCLIEARDGSLWAGTFVGGLTHLTDGGAVAYTTRDGLASDQVWSLLEDDDGSLWVGTNAGLNRLKDGRLSVFTTRDGLPNEQVRAIVRAPGGGLWLGTEGGLVRLKDGAFTVFTTRQGLANDQVRSLFVDGDGSLWVGTYGGGLSRFHHGSFTRYTTADGLPSDLIWSILRDRDRSLWVATSGGVARLEGDGHRFTAWTPKQGLSAGLVRQVYEDRTGNLWIGTNGGGLNRLRDDSVLVYGAVEGLSHEIVRTVLEDRDGAVWVATESGLNRFRDGRWTAFTTKDGLPDDHVFSLHQGRDGALWVGTHGGGLARLKDGRVRRWTTHDGLPSDLVRSLHEDRRGRLWIGTEKGVARLEGGRLTAYTTADGLTNHQVFVILEDRQGTLWFGTGGGGLNYYRGGRFGAYTTRDGLSSGVVFSLLEDDDDGTLWIGTDGGGLNRLRNGRLAAFTTKEGLHDDLVVQILDDRRGGLWLTSNRGVSRVARSALEDLAAGRRGSVSPDVYTTADGLRSNECHGGSQPAGVRTRDGRLWFPTLRGVAIIDPSRPRAAQPPPVVIEDVVVDRLRQPHAGTAGPELVPGADSLELHYTALDFRAPERLTFRYRLGGFDRDWVEAGTRRIAYYTRIPPGTYRFEVTACTHDGVCNEAGASLALRQRPHFWQTGWFLALTALSAVVLTVGAHRWRTHRLHQRHRELARLVEERTAQLREEKTRAEAASRAKSVFLANMSHELRTPLHAILGFVQLMERRQNRDAEDREQLGIILRSGEHLLGLINDVLSLSKIESGQVGLNVVAFDLRRLLRGLHEMFLLRAREKELELTFEAGSELPRLVEGDEGKLRQVLINLLGNAVKFTGTGGQIALRASWTDGRARFEVADDGPGIRPEDQEAIFGPFVQAVGAAVPEGGAGLGLAISRSFARLMGGDIGVESAPGRGATFRLEVPLPARTSAQEATAPARDLSGRTLGAPVDASPERLAAVGGQALLRLRRALVELDVERARRLVEEMAPGDPDLAAAVSRLIQTYRFDELEALVAAALAHCERGVR